MLKRLLTQTNELYSQEYMDVNKVARIYVTDSNMEFVFENMFPYETFIR